MKWARVWDLINSFSSMLSTRVLHLLLCLVSIPAFLLVDATGAYSPYISSDIHCDKDAHTSFITNRYKYYAPLHKFTNLTKSFFDLSWGAGTLVPNTTGIDNVPGATRAGEYGGYHFDETLTMYTSHPDALAYAYHGKGFKVSGQGINFGSSVKLYSYAEAFRFESICGGQATLIDARTYTCSDNPIATYDWETMLHDSTLTALAARIRAPMFTGDCLENLKRSYN
ncbi:hypothetical protein R3P38DRAFT_373811 [Favolaschia claudopus]|uniref:Uncharacterized protein n=1 Tax=Favolaschia claudopus TaxID=2862362 RepID=A0AAV9ZI93_9AGAR